VTHKVFLVSLGILRVTALDSFLFLGSETDIEGLSNFEGELLL
jgi:hypothetical protein